jgi:hypothetical protein
MPSPSKQQRWISQSMTLETKQNLRLLIKLNRMYKLWPIYNIRRKLVSSQAFKQLHSSSQDLVNKRKQKRKLIAYLKRLSKDN